MDSSAGIHLLFALEEKVGLLSTEQIKEEMGRLIAGKLKFTEKEKDEIIHALPIKWIEKEVYMDMVDKEIVGTLEDGDASLISLSGLTGEDVVTGDEGLLNIDIDGVAFRKLKDTIFGVGERR